MTTSFEPVQTAAWPPSWSAGPGGAGSLRHVRVAGSYDSAALTDLRKFPSGATPVTPKTSSRRPGHAPAIPESTATGASGSRRHVPAEVDAAAATVAGRVSRRVRVAKRNRALMTSPRSGGSPTLAHGG